MRLLIQEYVGMMKEEVELESVVSALVTSMGLDIRSLPPKGVRQDGVDLHAIGVDPDDNQKKNFLITIKQGNITRSVWDGNSQAVRASLNQIIDVYVQNKISVEDKTYPMKIILCCGGELRQEIQADWTGYQVSNSSKGLQFDLWNGSKLSSLIEKNLLNENVFFEDVRKKMRRTLVVLSDYGYDLVHYREMLNQFLFNDDWKNLTGAAIEKKALKSLSTIPVCLGMIHEYSKESNNSKHPLMAAEFALLRVWDFIRIHKLEQNEKVFAIYHQLFAMYEKFGAEYFEKTNPMRTYQMV
ncbi:MAG: hypothetical protein IPL83_02520 [Bdellovibrionales bacterium]|nr:hypothetical protein [Bdellovibrionales bacterium]